MDFRADQDFHFSAIERGVLDLLKVPLAPEAPEGSSQSIRVFHAGRQFYLWSILVWATRCVIIFAALSTISAAMITNIPETATWQATVGTVLIGLAWVVFIATAFVTFVARRINYLLRWYIVTDRSLRIRTGVFAVSELTMTYSNIQEIRVASGPLQYLLGLADVEVQAAGGGGGEKQRRSDHTGRFEGLSNANEVRDLIADRLRRYRDSGLGELSDAGPHYPDVGPELPDVGPIFRSGGADSPDVGPIFRSGGADSPDVGPVFRPGGGPDPSQIAAARAMLAEARALRAALSAKIPDTGQ